MSGRREYWAVVCPGKANVYGPFRNDLECANFLLRTHCRPVEGSTSPLMGTCDGKTKVQRHTITKMVKG